MCRYLKSAKFFIKEKKGLKSTGKTGSWECLYPETFFPIEGMKTATRREIPKRMSRGANFIILFIGRVV